MAKIDEFKSWVERDLDQWGGVKAHVEELEPEDQSVYGAEYHFRVYTFVNCYRITGRERALGQTQKEGFGYLGCVASTRKPRAGEDWNRGNDLSDGPLTEKTWGRILAAIVSYELVSVALPVEGPADTPSTE